MIAVARESWAQVSANRNADIGDLALVLGGGGVAGVAWMTGVLAGLGCAGFDLTGAGLVLGTSAGAIVGAQLTSGETLPELFNAQVRPDQQVAVPATSPGAVAALFAFMTELPVYDDDPAERLRAVGQMAVAADTLSEVAWRAAISATLPRLSWPKRCNLLMVAINVATGEAHLSDRNSGVDLVGAVAASSAIPAVFPPITLGRHRYFDGGIRSACNLDLAPFRSRTIVIAPMPDPDLDVHVAIRRQQGGRVFVVTPDAGSRAAFDDDPLDPAIRTPVARAGFVQGRGFAPRLEALWAP